MAMSTSLMLAFNTGAASSSRRSVTSNQRREEGIPNINIPITVRVWFSQLRENATMFVAQKAFAISGFTNHSGQGFYRRVTVFGV